MSTTTWTIEDEAALQQLQDRKDAFESRKRRAVEKLVEAFHYYNCGQDDVVSNLIEHAAEYIAALQPFADTQAKG